MSKIHLIHLVTYVDSQSAGVDSERDFEIGEKENQVGNSSTLKHATKGDIALITCKGGKKFKYVTLGDVILNEDERCNAWHQEGGKVWKYNFNIDKKLTTAITRSKVIEKFIRCECKNNDKINRFFHPRYTNVGYSDISNKLLKKCMDKENGFF